MKKYHQLLLLIVSVISLGLFLIYRHEYNRLHYILEVFNFFGQPCNVSGLQQVNHLLGQHDWGPIPTWQEQENGYTYSAFLTRQNEAKVLSLLNDEKFVPRNCYFWFEDRKKSVIGKFKFVKISKDKSNLYFYICQMINSDSIPYAISFSFKTRKENDLRKIMLTNTLKFRENFNTTVCVAPSVYSKRRLVEFLSFYKLLGVNSFIFYNRDIPHRLVKIITNFSGQLGLQATFLPWNFPKSDTTSLYNIVENDCLLRTSAHSLHSITLEMNEYIVPSFDYGFDSLLKRINTASDRISFPVQKFCISSTETTKPISVVNTDITEEYSFNLVRYLHINNQRREEISTSVADKSIVSVHKYLKCAVEPEKTHQDKSIWKYSTDLVRSTMFQLMLHNQI